MSGAQAVTPEEAPELHRMVEELAARANMPKPAVYIIETDMPNAFATGRSPQKAAVAATTGIMRILDYDELAGVMAHELAHIRNRDTLISSVAATIAGAVTFIAEMAQWSMLFSAFGGGDDEEEGAGGFVGALLMMILAPIAAMIIQMAISRAREFGADRGGAEILGDPLPLAAALEKLERWSQGAMAQHAETEVRPATAHMYIVNPLTGGAGLINLFRTHPPTEDRIARLREMAHGGDRMRAAA
jgi:heat shock protein HtpX